LLVLAGLELAATQIPQAPLALTQRAVVRAAQAVHREEEQAALLRRAQALLRVVAVLATARQALAAQALLAASSSHTRKDHRC
jgi:hypothetical protein